VRIAVSAQIVRHLSGRAAVLLLVSILLLSSAPLAAPQRALGLATTVSVRDFGARGDGVSDDTSAIRAAMGNGSSPRVVRFPAGTYVFADVALRSGVDIVFESGARAVSPSWATAESVFFTALGTATTPITSVSLMGGHFEPRPGGAIGGVFNAKYARGVRARNTVSVNVGRNIGAKLSDDIIVTACSATGARWGFAFEESTHIQVIECRTKSTVRDGILFYGRSRFATATGNIVETYMTGGDVGVGGIQVYGSSDATITDNVILDGRYDSAGIRFRDANVFWVENNYVESPGQSGLQVARVGDYPGLDGGDGTFIRNTVVRARLRGVDVANSLSKPVRVIDNVIIDTSSTSAVSAGMGIVTMPAGCVVVGNEIAESTGAGIQIGGSRQLVAENVLVNVGRINFGPRVGIFVTGTEHAVVGNSIIDQNRNTFNGVRLDVGSSALLRDNAIAGSSQAPLDVRGTRLSVLPDAVAPVVSTRITSQTPTSTTFALSASDAGWGAAGIWASIDGAPRKYFGSGGGPLVVSGAASHTLDVTVIDRAGNGASATRAVVHAATGPTVSGHVQRLSGANRFETAVAIARAGRSNWAGVRRVVVASGEDRSAADPLAAAGLTWAYDAPMLLVPSLHAPAGAKSIVSDIAAANPFVEIIVVGGNGAVPDAVVAELKAVAPGRVFAYRLAGRDRYATAARIAATMRRVGGGDVALVANGSSPASFFDALALSPIAGARGFPVLLTGPTALPDVTRLMVGVLGTPRVVVAGGSGPVSAGVVQTLHAERWAGANRYETAAAVAAGAEREGWLSPSTVGVAAGLPDALSGGAYLGAKRGVLLLTARDELSEITRQSLEQKRDAVHEIDVFGGVGAIPASVAEALEALVVRSD